MPEKPEREIWEVTLRLDVPAEGTEVGVDRSYQNPPSRWNFQMMLNDDYRNPDYLIQTIEAKKVS